MLTAVRRLSDNLLADIQASARWPADEAERVANALAEFGGASADWQLVEIPPALARAFDPRARQVGVFEGEVLVDISETVPPTLVAERAAVLADDADLVTLTFDAGDPAYSGPVAWLVVAPDGTCTAVTGTAAAGVDTWQLSTPAVGAHIVVAATGQHGLGTLAFEGVLDG